MRIAELQTTLRRLLDDDFRSGSDLGQISGISPQYLYQVRTGKRGLATRHVDAVLAALGFELELKLVPLSPGCETTNDAEPGHPAGTAR